MNSDYKISLYHKEYSFTKFVKLCKENGEPADYNISNYTDGLFINMKLIHTSINILNDKNIDLIKYPMIPVSSTEYPENDRTVFTLAKYNPDKPVKFDILFHYFRSSNAAKIQYETPDVNEENLPEYINLINEYTMDDYIKEINSKEEVYKEIIKSIKAGSSITVAYYLDGEKQFIA